MNLDELAQECHQIAVDHGWWENWDRNVLEQVALMHSELSEALEAYRDNPDPTYVWAEDPFGVVTTLDEIRSDTDFPEFKWKLEGFGPELAGAIIRILDTCGRYLIPIEELVELCVEYNRYRPYKHGGKIA